MERMKRAISMMLAVVMLTTACPISVFATTADTTEVEETESSEDYLALSGTPTGGSLNNANGTEEAAPNVENGESAEISTPTEDTSAPDKSEESGTAAETAEIETLPDPTASDALSADADSDQDIAIPSEDEAAEEFTITENVIEEGTCGDNLTWVLDADGVLTISGTGDMTNYYNPSTDNSNLSPWYSHKDDITALVLNDGITSIGNHAFYGCYKLAEVTFPESLTVIGLDAFHGCTGMTGITFPESLTTIDAGAFSGCTGMTGGLTIPAAVTSIGFEAFYNCTGLDGKLIIEAGSKTIGEGAFQNCYKLTGLELGSGITRIEDGAFGGCRSMTGDLTIPDSVTRVGDAAFGGCYGFNGKLTLSENLTTIAAYCFNRCSFTGALVIPDKVTTIEEAAFSELREITSIVFGENLTSIGTGPYPFSLALNQMYGVKEITFKGPTVPLIEHGYAYGSALRDLTGLETVYVPAEAYDAYVSAFSGKLSESVVFCTDIIGAEVANFKAERIYSQSVVLSWDAHTSNRVIGYTISRNGEVIATTSELCFTDRGLVTGTKYTYSVQGYTEEGQATPATEISVTPTGPSILYIQTDNRLNKVDDEHSTISIYVSDNKNLQPLGSEQTVGKLYYLNGETPVLIGKAELSTTSGGSATAVYTVHWDISALEDGEYALLFTLTDVDGATDTHSERIRIDRSVPAQIVGVTAIADAQKIYLAWEISSEADTGVYRIYRRAESEQAFRMVAQINDRNTLTYPDSDVTADQIYYYYVVGVSGFGTEGKASEIVGATLSADTEAPTVTKLTPANASYLTGIAKFTLTAEDNVSATSAALYFSVDNCETWTLIAEMRAGNFSTSFDTTTLADGAVHVKGIAYDAAGNESSALTYAYSVDNTGPKQVQGLSYESTNVTVTLSWNNVADKDICYYRVEQKVSDGYTTVSDVYSTLGINIYNLTPATEYTYRVVGYDMHGNRGTPSEDITVSTVDDTTAPVITRILPASGYYSTSIGLSITATDEYGVSKILLQTSTDAFRWTDFYTESYSDIQKARTLSYELPLDGYSEGAVYVRAIATDTAGNESDSSVNAPYAQHIVDRTAPSAPDSVEAKGNSGGIEISWAQGSETDLGKYSVYRAESEDGTFALLNDAIAATNYIDRNVKAGVVYYYKVAVNDIAGNESKFSAVVWAEAVKDTEAPKIYSVYPGTGSSLGIGFKTVSVLAVDNHALDRVLIEYSTDGKNYRTLQNTNNINAYNITLSTDIPVAELNNGDTVYVRFSATDVSGNTCEYAVYTYSMDALAPTVKSAAAEFADGKVTISWTGNMEEDLSGYRIYRKTGLTGPYRLIAQRQAVAGKETYTCSDGNLSDEEVTNFYKIEAVDQCGNTSSIAAGPVTLPDRSMPTPVISCESTQKAGVEYVIDGSLSKDNTGIVSYLFDFGDGTTSTSAKPIHVYTQTGEYSITLTVTDDDGHTSSTTKVISVKDSSLIGTVKIRIVDENGVAVAGAPVYFDLGSENQVVKNTDSSGYATFSSDVGKHTVGCIIANNEWLPVKKNVIVRADAVTSTTMTMVRHVLIDGQYEITRMTFDEITAAGIDVSNPENQQIVKIKVTLTYSDADDVDLSFYYNIITGASIIITEVIDGITNGGNSGSGEGDEDGGCWNYSGRKFFPVVAKSGSSISNVSKSTIAVLEMPIEASFLKEFFDVKLHILNNASTEFSMTDNVVTLNVPEGLTIVNTDGTEGDSVVRIPEITGQSTKTINWILRGDKEGQYYLSANYTGTLSQFNEQVSAEFIAKKPIQVYGMRAVKMTAEVNSTIRNDAFYFNLSIQNVSDADVYMPSIGVIGDVLSTYLDTVTAKSRDNDEAGEGGTAAVPQQPMDYNKPSVRHLNTLLSNASGFCQAIGTSTTVTGLSPGETLTNKYAVYNVVGYNNILYLTDAIYEIAGAYGIQFEIVETDMDLFGMDNASEKLDELNRNHEKYSMFSYITGNQNFFYVMESLERNQDVLGLIGEGVYGSAKLILNLDANYNTDETKEITRKLVAQLLMDESMQQTIDVSIDTKFLDITSSTLNAISSMVAESPEHYGVAASNLDAFKEIISDSSNIRAFSGVLREDGLNGMLERFSEVCVSTGVSLALNRDLLFADVVYSGVFRQAVGEACSKVDGVVGRLDTVFSDWNTSAELTRNLVAIAAAEEEAIALLDILIEYTDPETAIYDELVTIRESINTVSGEMATQFITRLTQSVIHDAAGNEVGAILKYMDFSYGTDYGVIYTIAKLTFGTLNYVFDWGGTIGDLHVLRVNTAISFALSSAVGKYGLTTDTNEQALYTLKSLKYLIKMRLIGEQSFVDIKNRKESQAEDLAWVNETRGSSYSSLDEYARDVIAQLLTYRDTIFATYHVKPAIPEAPAVTVNYLTNTTNEAFSSSYEYSFEGTQWYDCTGSQIAFEPGTVARWLWVRVKETSTSVSGNIIKIVIPAMPRITGDVSVVYNGSNYQISGLKSGTYQYSFTNQKDVTALSKTFAVAQGETVTIPETADWTYLAIRTPATETNFESQIRYLVTEKPNNDWVIITEKKIVTGIPEATTVSEVVTYYTNQGYFVTVTSANGDETEVVGTGCILNLDGEAYSIVVLGDVNGDAAIDIFDLYIMLDHINSVTALSGAYLDAGCVCQNEDIDIFDAYSELAYINSGSFSKQGGEA